MAETIHHFIAGKSHADRGERRGEVFNPATGEVARHVALGGLSEVDVAVKAAKAAFPEWAATPPLTRARVMFRFRESANPVPSKTSHNTLIEVIWTVGPVVILLFLAIPSFQLLTAQLSPEDPKLTIKATGYQWYWGYEYQTAENPLSFDSLILKDEDRAAAGKEDRSAYPRLLAVDNEVVVPVNTSVRVLVTAGDVIHAFAMPAFGVKIDAVPGRMNETWFKAEKEGLYYGQCSEICGKDHAFMPIAIRVVSEEQYNAWYAAAGSDLQGAYKTLAASIDANKNINVAGN